MGKKKNKNKVSGAVKTAAKTEKKLANKLKKELANLGEEDIAKVIAEIEREEAKRSAATEKALPGPPSPRAYATLTPHPTNNELILFGGEYHNGQKTEVYNELLFYNPTNNSWKVLKAPGAPPPRSAHQTIATPANNPRSGHRMALLGRNIIVFGGYADDGRECRYFDDVYSFCLDTRTWSKLAPSGRGPTARSACVMLPAGNDSDVEETEEELRGEMSDDLQLLDMETGKWHIVTLRSELQGAKPAVKEEEKAQKEEETVTDLHKLNDWKTLIEQPSLPDWLGSDSEDEETGSDSESESDSDSD
ncbi:hypothetical protein HF086_001117 [Spodoptera exigua]|uniref:Uncharacterized protein n=1 Tax=Spodoptera exigua TaxID=7107 RepID=A0A922M352_SPOEX|nr:hypothetical protein HF086_001117 [Spodoptera exigua]